MQRPPFGLDTTPGELEDLQPTGPLVGHPGNLLSAGQIVRKLSETAHGFAGLEIKLITTHGRLAWQIEARSREIMHPGMISPHEVIRQLANLAQGVASGDQGDVPQLPISVCQQAVSLLELQHEVQRRLGFGGPGTDTSTEPGTDPGTAEELAPGALPITASVSRNLPQPARRKLPSDEELQRQLEAHLDALGVGPGPVSMRVPGPRWPDPEAAASAAWQAVEQIAGVLRQTASAGGPGAEQGYAALSQGMEAIQQIESPLLELNDWLDQQLDNHLEEVQAGDRIPSRPVVEGLAGQLLRKLHGMIEATHPASPGAPAAPAPERAAVHKLCDQAISLMPLIGSAGHDEAELWCEMDEAVSALETWLADTWGNPETRRGQLN